MKFEKGDTKVSIPSWLIAVGMAGIANITKIVLEAIGKKKS